MPIIDANNPFLSYKLAIQFALGCKAAGRPVFKSRGINSITLADELQDHEVIFGDLNYKYISELPAEDITVFETKEFGQFFYEYGRTILANLAVCLTKADWNSVAIDSNGVAPYLGNYYNNLINLDDKLDEVITTFKKEAITESDYLPFDFDYHKASDIIKRYKSEVQQSKMSNDMKNTEIFFCAYVGLLFSLYGMFILFSQIEQENDLYSFIKSPKSVSFLGIYEAILKGATLGDNEKKHLITLVYAFYKMSDFYRRTSGLKEFDSFIGTMFDISEIFVAKFDGKTNDEAQTILSLIDPDLMDKSFANGCSLDTFCGKCDPLMDTMYFRSANVIERDNPNIFDFGMVYLRAYKLESDTEEEKLTTDKFLEPAMKTYLEAGIKPQYANEDVERAFGVVRNLITGVDDSEQFSKVEPGFILQLVMLAATFRILNNRSTVRSDKARNEVNAAIDILDIMVLKLYHMWFGSSKYFIQPNRPNYCGGKEGINATLNELKNETISILKYYFEFVRFGISSIPESDKLLYKTFKYEEVVYETEEVKPNWLNKHFPFVDKDTFIKLCATKNGKTITQLALFEKTDDSFPNIIKHYENKNMPKSVIKSLTVSPENHTGIDHIDRVIDLAYDVKKDSETNPEIYAVAVFAMLYFSFDMIVRKFNVGNYFDFGEADNSINSYLIEHTVAKLVAAPLKRSVEMSGL